MPFSPNFFLWFIAFISLAADFDFRIGSVFVPFESFGPLVETLFRERFNGVALPVDCPVDPFDSSHAASSLFKSCSIFSWDARLPRARTTAGVKPARARVPYPGSGASITDIF